MIWRSMHGQEHQTRGTMVQENLEAARHSNSILLLHGELHGLLSRAE